ncbi:DUF2283 domain-containing protein [Candidatus Woesearchaeota archaeon]|nr:DUF2283 domain-containing protein [Candidatus Woesearchaeota archaeon]
MKGSMRIYYDEEGDFLEIMIGKPSEGIAEEVQPGVFVRRDMKNNEIKSIGILNFKKRTKKIPDIDLSIPVKIEIST